MVMGGDSFSNGCGFESQHCIQGGHFFTFICCKNCNAVCLKRQKSMKKRPGMVFVFEKVLKAHSGKVHLMRAAV